MRYNYFFKKQYCRITLTMFLVYCFVFPVNIFAASGSLTANRPPSVSEQFILDVFVDTEGENINSMEVSLDFPFDQYKFEGYEADGGVISLWVVKPFEASPGKIRFSGVVPGGVERLYDPLHTTQKALPIARLLFRPLREGEGEFVLKDTTLFRNDGEGSLIGVPRFSKKFVVLPERPFDTSESLDKTPPFPFVIEQIEGSSFGKTPSMLLFTTIDKDSGIERYEVRVGKGKFVTTTSPFPTPQRLLPYSVTVRAVDFAGNYQDAVIVLPGSAGAIKIVLIAIVGVIAIVIYVYRRRIAISK